MKIRIITIGNEILFGQIVDSNSAYIAQKLNQIGLEVDEIRSIPDDPESIKETLHRLQPESDVLILSGGLGPTKDDLTKKALCDFLKTDLVTDESVLNDLEERFKKNNRILNGLNRDQALMPRLSTALPNPLGTAPGIWTEYEKTIIINLPGVPFEMKNLVKTEVIPRLQKKFDLPYVIHRFLSVSNFPESDLSILLEEWEDHLAENLQLAYLPERGKVKLRITAKGKDKFKLEEKIESEVQKLIPLLGNHLDSITKAKTEEILGDRLRELNLTISTAESCTGGMIAQLITSVPGCSDYYKGSIVSYARSVKEKMVGVSQETIDSFTVVSEEVALEMAKGVREKLETDLGISTTGVAGPSLGEDGKEVGTVWMAIADEKKTWTKKYFFPYLEREDFISQTSKTALQNVLKFISPND